MSQYLHTSLTVVITNNSHVRCFNALWLCVFLQVSSAWSCLVRWFGMTTVCCIHRTQPLSLLFSSYLTQLQEAHSPWAQEKSCNSSNTCLKQLTLAQRVNVVRQCTCFRGIVLKGRGDFFRSDTCYILQSPGGAFFRTFHSRLDMS